MALSNKRKAFVAEYLKDFNATQAAIRAGYSEVSARVTGHRLLTDDNIAGEIQRCIAEKTMDADEVLTRLAEHARAEHGEYISPAGEVDLDGIIANGKAHLIKGIKHTQHGDNIEFYDAQAALVHIGRHHGLFTDVTEHRGGDKPIPVAIVQPGLVGELLDDGSDS